MNYLFIKFAIIAIIIGFISAEVIELTSKNFEHLTQASTGATTGAWLIDFYAPWCGHCKSLAPIYEKVAQKLKEDDSGVNVATVDVPANRDLGTRFEIKGFPTIKFLKDGKVFTYKGKRTLGDLVEFAKGGYLTQEATEVPPQLGFFGEIQFVFKQAYKQAKRDVSSGNYFTADVFLLSLPLIFISLLVLFVFIPIPTPPAPQVKAQVATDKASGKSE